MHFGVLGALEARSEDGPVALGGLKPRALLACLLSTRPSRSALSAWVALWGEDAAPGAAKTVQVHVSRLRKALAGARELVARMGARPTAVRLALDEAGWLLEADPGRARELAASAAADARELGLERAAERAPSLLAGSRASVRERTG